MPIKTNLLWSYGPEYQGLQNLPDPRLALARHTAWIRSSTPYTDYPTPEPENYNRAIFAHFPIDCKIIEDQVFYYDQSRSGWITLMYVPEEQTNQIDAWIIQCRPLAVWCHVRTPRVKPQKHLLWTKSNISDRNMTDNERLYTMGYYDELKVKYFNDDVKYIDSLLGTARAILKDPIPEELDDEVEDF